MELKKWQKNITTILGKYKYAILIFAIGLALMLIPDTVSIRSKTEKSVSQEPVSDNYSDTIQQELETILGYIQGAGNVKVMLKEQSGSETVYQTNEDHSESDSSSATKTNVITITDSSRGEYGLIRQINPPKYQGAIVLCQGADDPNVRLSIADAVSKITGLGTDKIAVLKMK